MVLLPRNGIWSFLNFVRLKFNIIQKYVAGIEDIDAPLLAETRATISDGYLNVVSYGTATT